MKEIRNNGASMITSSLPSVVRAFRERGNQHRRNDPTKGDHQYTDVFFLTVEEGKAPISYTLNFIKRLSGKSLSLEYVMAKGFVAEIDTETREVTGVTFHPPSRGNLHLEDKVTALIPSPGTFLTQTYNGIIWAPLTEDAARKLYRDGVDSARMAIDKLRLPALLGEDSRIQVHGYEGETTFKSIFREGIDPKGGNYRPAPTLIRK